MPGVQHKQQARGELDQTYPPQVHHIACQLVEVPANGHGEHLKRTGGEDTGKPEGHKWPVMAEQEGLAGHLKGIVAEDRERRDYHCFVTNNDSKYHSPPGLHAGWHKRFLRFPAVLATVYIKA
jgi:hypothetical protein